MSPVCTMYQYRWNIFWGYSGSWSVDTTDGVARPSCHIWASAVIPDNEPLLEVLFNGVPDDLLGEILLRPLEALAEVSQEVGQSDPTVFRDWATVAP